VSCIRDWCPNCGETGWACTCRAKEPEQANPVKDSELLMREFYLSRYYDPKAARPADNVKAAIEFAIEAAGVADLQLQLKNATDLMEEVALAIGDDWPLYTKALLAASAKARAALASSRGGE